MKNSTRRQAITALAERDGWQCHYCGDRLYSHQEISQLFAVPQNVQPDGRYEYSEIVFPAGVDWPTLDHKVPTVLGGPDDLDNLVLCCRPCNTHKGDTYSYAEFVEMKKGGQQ
jgi:hypothetical protein